MKQVLLNLPWYDQALHKGVSSYSSEVGWHLVSSLEGIQISSWTGDGLITRVCAENEEYSKRLRAQGVSIVDVQSRARDIKYPSVATNLKETTGLAFDYFRHHKGFQYFGFVGSTYSFRGKEFEKHVNNEGFDCAVCHIWYRTFSPDSTELRDWISSLSLPIGIYCDNDNSASALTSVLLDMGVDIPNSVAVLGTDNNELVCTSSYVPISSIDTNLFEVGRKAAELLDIQMNGGTVDLRKYSVSPRKIVERASTDTLAVKSAKVREAIATMKRDFRHQLSISDVVADMNISQASLERAFKRELGVTPAVCLRDIRMREAAKLLRITSEKIEAISNMVGIPNSKHFATVFRKVWGMSPRQYRQHNMEAR